MRSRTSDWRRRTRSWKRRSTAALVRTGVAAQAGWAARARSKAVSTSSGVDSGRSASFSPVKGVWLAVRPEPTTPRVSRAITSGVTTSAAVRTPAGAAATGLVPTREPEAAAVVEDACESVMRPRVCPVARFWYPAVTGFRHLLRSCRPHPMIQPVITGVITADQGLLLHRGRGPMGLRAPDGADPDLFAGLRRPARRGRAAARGACPCGACVSRPGPAAASCAASSRRAAGSPPSPPPGRSCRARTRVRPSHRSTSGRCRGAVPGGPWSRSR